LRESHPAVQHEDKPVTALSDFSTFLIAVSKEWFQSLSDCSYGGIGLIFKLIKIIYENK
jgi:hypothetical protein